jgi:hypothetical protein
MGEFKREFKLMCDNYGIKAKPTTSHNIPSIHKQMQSLSEYTKLSMTCSDNLTWKTKNNHENLEEQEKQEDNPFDYFLQSIEWFPCY